MCPRGAALRCAVCFLVGFLILRKVSLPAGKRPLYASSVVETPWEFPHATLAAAATWALHHRISQLQEHEKELEEEGKEKDEYIHRGDV